MTPAPDTSPEAVEKAAAYLAHCCEVDFDHVTGGCEYIPDLLRALSGELARAREQITEATEALEWMTAERDQLRERCDTLEPDAARLDFLGDHLANELSFNRTDAEAHRANWQVHRHNCSANDREWWLVGEGASVREAIDAAMPQGPSHG
jgi:hypothetical protein